MLGQFNSQIRGKPTPTQNVMGYMNQPVPGVSMVTQLTPAQEMQYETRILALGNEILDAFQAEGMSNDISMFQFDNFYLQIFNELFPEQGFINRPQGNTEDEMAANIDSILDYVENLVPEFDIQTLNGDMIVAGDLPQIEIML